MWARSACEPCRTTLPTAPFGRAGCARWGPGWTNWAVELEPSARAAGAIGRIPPLRDDAFEPELAGVTKDRLTVVAFQMLVEADAGSGLGQHRRERRLADLQRLAPQI